ncbi:hypothetical protein TSTA_033170 [Talaromyces stipitatus ATCC 10500]|uniref:Uncharacterized protein n=1 Tax=Talaromyces stipitatus (strain ATCC 10500 / CBS 375.48 / QM 6759 / NRRL 1006) TaxID=441959 RepID=B8M5U3_TALSN|nr:uncharacterized protein TSTA_033170 [Talaromyces stipitatus ATCC 10500]EED20070.1 hypothetical protein TSTA_033170 [Talaromyces stipitatus ATCC 10500]
MFRRNSSKELSDRIHYLAQENYFCAICNNVISIPYQETVAALLRFSLLLVGSKDSPTRSIAREGPLTLKDLEQYVHCLQEIWIEFTPQNMGEEAEGYPWDRMDRLHEEVQSSGLKVSRDEWKEEIERQREWRIQKEMKRKKIRG